MTAIAALSALGSYLASQPAQPQRPDHAGRDVQRRLQRGSTAAISTDIVLHGLVH